MRFIIPIAACICVMAICAVGYLHKAQVESTPKPHVTVMHTGSEGCPSGYTPHRDYFIEEDGSMQGACVAFWEGGEGTQIDYLLSGETVTLSFEVGTK